MKKILLIVLSAALLISCAKDVTPRVNFVPAIAPKVEQVAKQAQISTTSAEKTEELASIAAEKYKDDPFVKAVKESAKSTVVETKKTQFEIEFLKEYAKNVDIKADELEQTAQQQEDIIIKKDAKLRSSETTIIKQQAKISSRNGYLIGAGALILILGSLILKPWKWFL